MRRQVQSLEQIAVTLGRQALRCDVTRRPARRLVLTVFPDQRVLVAAPQGVPLESVRLRAQRRASWIFKQVDRFERFQPIQPPHQCLNGATHLLLGRQYRLKIVLARHYAVALNGSRIVIHTPFPQKTAHVGQMLDRWYLRSARRFLTQRFEVCWQKFRYHKVSRPTLRLCRMRKRWGSCTQSGTITLNRDLVKASANCIDYAILHELCHLREHNHGRAFYQALRQCLPDWENRKVRLDMAMASSG